MPIVRHVLEQGAQQADGGRQCTVRMYDQFDVEYTQSFYAPAQFDINARIVSMKAATNEQLAVNELEELLASALPAAMMVMR